MNSSYTIDGYRFIEKIGMGNHTEVWKVHHKDTSRDLAMKLIPARYANPMVDIDDYIEQLQYIGQIGIDEAIKMYEFGEQDGHIYFVFELIEGLRVSEWIEEKGKLDPELTLDLAESVVTALKHAWDDAALMHGDLSTRNIMVSNEGDIKVADLGISGIVHEFSHRPDDPAPRGNAYFVSPKQAGGGANLDCRTDIYALGAVLYNALTGDMPFGHMKPADARVAHIESQLSDPRGIQPNTPTTLVMMIEKMLAKGLGDRYTSWDQVLAAIAASRAKQALPHAPLAPGLSTLKREHSLDTPLPAAPKPQTDPASKKFRTRAVPVPGQQMASPTRAPASARHHARKKKAAQTHTRVAAVEPPTSPSDRSAREVMRQKKKVAQKKSPAIMIAMISLGGLLCIGALIATITASNRPAPIQTTSQTAPLLPGSVKSTKAPPGSTLTSGHDTRVVPSPEPAPVKQPDPVVLATPANTGAKSGTKPEDRVVQVTPKSIEPDVGDARGRNSPGLNLKRAPNTVQRPVKPMDIGLKVPDHIRNAAPTPSPETTPPGSANEQAPADRIVKPTKAGTQMDVLADRKENIFWQVGRLNGKPAEGENSDEFDRITASEEIIFVNDAREFVQSLNAGQITQVSLKNLQAVDTILRVAISSKLTPSKDYSGAACDYDARRLKIRHNERVVWSRWLSPGHSIVEVFIPGAYITGVEDRLVIQNTGQEVLTFDAVWLEKPTADTPLSIALQGADWIGKDLTSRDVAARVNMPALPPATASLTPSAIAAFESVSTPQTLLDSISGIKNLTTAAQGASLIGSAQQKTDDAWREELTAVLTRGLIPVVRVPAAGDPNVWLLWAQRYGSVISQWELIGTPKDVAMAAAQIHSRVPDARISQHVTRQDLQGSAAQLKGINGLAFNRKWGPHGARTDMIPGLLRNQFWNKGYFATAGLPHWLTIRPQDASRADISVQRVDAASLAESAVQWWMAGGQHLVLGGVTRGGPFFPDGTDRHAYTWDSVRLLLPLGLAGQTRVVANLLPASGDETTADACWAASGNGKDLVQAIVFAGSRDENREMLLDIPVPWKGRTVVRIDSIQFNGRENDPVFNEPAETALNSAASSSSGESGFARVPLTLTSLQLVRLVPSTRRVPPLPGENYSPAGLDRTNLSRDLLAIEETPIPAQALLTSQPVRQPLSPADRLGPGCNHEAAKATPGQLRAWSPLRAGQSRLVTKVLPWAAQSDVLTFPGAHSPLRPRAIRLYLNPTALAAADRVAIWMRSLPAGRDLPRRQAPQILMGSPDRYQLLTPGKEWSCVVLDTDKLKAEDGSLPGFITVWQDPSDPSPARVEFNGYVGIRKPPEENAQVVTGLAGAMEEPDVLLIAVVGKAESAGQWHCRLSSPQKLEMMKRIFRKPGEERPEDRALAVPVRAQDAGANLEFTTQIADAHYRTGAQVLLIDIKRFPPRTENPSKDALKELFPSIDWEQLGKQSILLFQFDRSRR